MSLNVGDLSPEDRAALLAALQEEDRRARAEQRAEESLNRTLRRRLVEAGIEHHGEWEKPKSAMCSYPKGWAVYHNGRDWVATVTCATDEPSDESEQWGPYDSHVEGDDSFERTEEDVEGEKIPGPIEDPEGAPEILDPIEEEDDVTDVVETTEPEVIEGPEPEPEEPGDKEIPDAE